MQLMPSTVSKSQGKALDKRVQHAAGRRFMPAIAHHHKLQVLALEAAAPSGSDDWMDLSS